MPDAEYQFARVEAGRRHNAELAGHAGRPRSSGDGVVIACGCGQGFGFDAWRSHIYRICVETPVPMRRTE